MLLYTILIVLELLLLIICFNTVGVFIIIQKSLKWIDEGLSNKEICKKQNKYAIFLCPLILPFLEK